MAFGFGGGGVPSGGGGFGGSQAPPSAGLASPYKKNATAYDLFGNPIETTQANADTLGGWQPNTGYSSDYLFRAPPPQGLVGEQTAAQMPALSQSAPAAAPRASSAPASVQIPSLPPPRPAGPSQEDIWAREDRVRADEQAYQSRTSAEQRAYADQTRAAETARMSGIRESALKSLKDVYDQMGAGKPTFQHLDSPELRQANATEYGRAKSNIGRERLNALRSLQGVMDARGLTGSTGRGLESGATASIVGSGLDELGDVELRQAQDTVARDRQMYDTETSNFERRRQSALDSLLALYRQLGVQV